MEDEYGLAFEVDFNFLDTDLPGLSARTPAKSLLAALAALAAPFACFT
jgi:hypothetical protein